MKSALHRVLYAAYGCVSVECFMLFIFYFFHAIHRCTVIPPLSGERRGTLLYSLNNSYTLTHVYPWGRWNIPLGKMKYTPRGTCTPGWETLHNQTHIFSDYTALSDESHFYLFFLNTFCWPCITTEVASPPCPLFSPRWD